MQVNFFAELKYSFGKNYVQRFINEDRVLV